MLKKIGIIILILIISILLIYSKPLLQEGNPIPILSGIIKLNFTNKDIVQISEDGSKYVTKSKNGINSITQFMKDKNYKLADQMGSGYVFEKEDKSIIITHRYYSTFYDIWYFPNQ